MACGQPGGDADAWIFTPEKSAVRPLQWQLDVVVPKAQQTAGAALSLAEAATPIGAVSEIAQQGSGPMPDLFGAGTVTIDAIDADAVSYSVSQADSRIAGSYRARRCP